jgi:GT2 family glycosyltransferase
VDDLAWQALSVAARRDALRQSGPTAALDSWPSVSIVLVTHRPDHLERALRQVGALRYPRLEVVLGIHGDRVDGARAWELAQAVGHPVTMVAIDAARTLGEALQACSDRAEGALVTKMDDDDVYGPEHVWDLVLAREYSGAQVVGKALDWIHLESEDATVFRPVYAAEKYANFVAGGTMLISRADLNAVGGWRPVPKSVDRALLDRVLAAGGLVYRTHGLGYVYVRHAAGHTAMVSDAHFLTKTTARYPGLLKHPEFGTDSASGGPS